LILLRLDHRFVPLTLFPYFSWGIPVILALIFLGKARIVSFFLPFWFSVKFFFLGVKGLLSRREVIFFATLF